MSIITLTTDFGVRDWFVGTLKGVIMGIAPNAQIVDITHEISPGAVLAGAFALAASCRFFPPGTVHVAIIDPGVGSARAAIAAGTPNCQFVGPDNGVLSLALAHEQVQSIRRLDNEKFFLKPVSHTFHGRDVFAPVAAHLSKGLALREVGPELRDFERIALPQPEEGSGRIKGTIIYIDRFGNAITNLPEKLSLFQKRSRLAVRAGRGKSALPLGEYYQAVAPGRPLALIGSSGFLEIAVNGGNAAERLRLKVGDPVSVRTLHPD